MPNVTNWYLNKSLEVEMLVHADVDCLQVFLFCFLSPGFNKNILLFCTYSLYKTSVYKEILIKINYILIGSFVSLVVNLNI